MNYKCLVFGGDLNVDFNQTYSMSTCLNEFFNELDIVPVYPKLSSDLKVSFYVESTGASSLVDHFVVSKSLVDSIDHYAVLDSGINFSDHCPVIMHINFPSSLPSYAYRMFQKTDTQFYFWDNFGNSAPILTVLSLLQAEIHGA